MPDHEEHCQHSLKRYGVRGDDIHSYIDEPCKIARQGHRVYRHDTTTIKLVGQIFGAKYGSAFAESIALDHITADHEEEISRRSNGIEVVNSDTARQYATAWFNKGVSLFKLVVLRKH
jgi:glycine cleavage system aminomethyltransferase T